MTTTTTTKTVTIRVRNVGINFGCVGQLVCRGKVVATTRQFPHGHTGGAYDAAAALAAARGWRVREA
jgi:hypothetical protein